MHILFEGIWLDIQTRVGTPHTLSLENQHGWVGGWFFQEILPLCGYILLPLSLRGGRWVIKVIFMSNPTTVEVKVMLCYIKLSLGL